MTQVTITTETDLSTGRMTFILPGNPVPVITPMGPAPGELRVETERDGRVTAVRAVLKPRGADVAQMADVLARIATFPLNAADLRGLVGGKPVVTFALKADAVSGLSVRVTQADQLEALLRQPALQEGHRYVVEDLEVTG